MKKTVFGILLLIASPALAETYSGHGKETPYGIETCGMIVEETGPTLIIRMMALNQEVTAIVAEHEGSEQTFSVRMISRSNKRESLSIKASGKLRNHQPVSFRMEVLPHAPLLGNEKETIDCRF